MLYDLHNNGGKKKLLTPKLVSLLKHASHCKSKVFMPKVDASSYCQQKLNPFPKWMTIPCWWLTLFQFDVSSNHKKYVQFVSIYHILVHGHPIMFNFENFKALFHKVEW
jgi:hypothetical protein